MSSKTKGESIIIEAGLKPFSNAAAYKNGLKFEPNCGFAWKARFNWLFLKLYPPTKANISPLVGLILTNADWTSGCTAIDFKPLRPSSFDVQMRSPLLKKSEKSSNLLSFRFSLILGLIEFFNLLIRIFSIWPSLFKANILFSWTEIIIAGSKVLNFACFSRNLIAFEKGFFASNSIPNSSKYIEGS